MATKIEKTDVGKIKDSDQVHDEISMTPAAEVMESPQKFPGGLQPLKLMSLLRRNFGIGRYEIWVSAEFWSWCRPPGSGVVAPSPKG